MEFCELIEPESVKITRQGVEFSVLTEAKTML